MEQYDILSIIDGPVNGILKQNGTKAWLMTDDLHWVDDSIRMKKTRSLQVADMILSTYKHKIRDLYPSISESLNIVSVPHSTTPRFFTPFNKNPINKILLAGQVCQ
jgi:hypothetical protein